MNLDISANNSKTIIKLIRKNTGLTQNEFSKKINKSIAWVQSCEVGRLNYSVNDLLKILETFDLTITLNSKD